MSGDDAAHDGPAEDQLGSTEDLTGEEAPRRRPSAPEPLHASAVALDQRALLILGPSGSGKTTLALEMIAFGAELVADDRVLLAGRGALTVVAPVPRLAGLIEIRGAGILRHPYRAPVPALCAVDLGETPSERMPKPWLRRLGGVALPCLAGRGIPAAALLAILRVGRLPDPVHATSPAPVHV
ncbi:MAG: HPr kinase/phosphatase C-terminal domain-containing protein [Pseudomonadota bacterium]